MMNDLTILDYAYTKYTHKYYKIKCYCGNVFICRLSYINSKRTKSCGCLRSVGANKSCGCSRSVGANKAWKTKNDKWLKDHGLLA